MKNRILVVDDEPSVLHFVSRALGLQGYTVAEAVSGEQALELLSRERFDLLATDLLMPGMSGLDLMDRISALGIDLPAIVITGMGTLDTSVQALRAGAVDFITKPFGRSELSDAVARALVQAHLAQERARLRVLVPVLELARRVREGAGIAEVCDALADLAYGQPGAVGAAIVLEQPGLPEPLALSTRGVLEELTAEEINAMPAPREGELLVRGCGELTGHQLRDYLQERRVETLVATTLSANEVRFGELWIALSWTPDRFDPHYADAVELLGRHAANLLLTWQQVRSLSMASGF